jgi:hypothetical protein
VELDFTGLVKRLQRAKDKIEKIIFWAHPNLASGKLLEDALKGSGLSVGDVQSPSPIN